MLVFYVDAMADRRSAQVAADRRWSVEAVRMGWIFAHDQRQYQRWLRKTAKRDAALDGWNLEAAVAALHLTNPEYVVMG